MKPRMLGVMTKSLGFITLLLVLTTPCHATVYHTLRKGESLAIVAKQYYGDPGKAIFLLEYNGVRDPRTVKPGRRIVIPEVKFHQVQRGDTLALIAKRYLNDAKKSRALAQLNRIQDPKSLTPGTKVTIPVEILHTVRKGESLSSIAKRYYGHFDASKLIARYNGIKDPINLEVGTRLILPISDLHIVKKKKSPSRPSARPSTPPRGREGEAFLEKGTSDYFMGDYIGSVKNLKKAVASGLTKNDDISKAHRFLAYSYVALNDREKAKDSFRQALRVDPDLQLDPVYVSPKIMEVFEEVKGGEE